MAKASVAVAIVARDAERTIAACLDSIVPHVEQVVVCIDALSTDKTAEVAVARGAEVYPVEVSEWHDCAIHGHVLAQHFGRARNESFTHLRKDLDWWFWVDSDDVVSGADKLAEYLTGLPTQVEGVWLPYNYARVDDRPDGAVTTRFDRERILRSRVGWEWLHRVHEIAAPIGRKAESLNWTRTEAIEINHQGKGHNVAASARRNILLLEMELEERPGDQWALFYLGNQWFALGDWQLAAQAYEAATQNDNTYQLWQTYVYLSMTYEKLGQIDQSRGAALRAIDLIPNHPEPYYRMAVANMLMGQDRKVEWWTALGDQQVDPPPFVFRNPLDRPYNSRVTLGQTLANARRYREALAALTAADRAVKNPDVQRGVQDMTLKVAEQETAEATVRLLEGQSNGRVLDVWRALDLPPEVRAFPQVRDVVVPAILKARPNTQPRIVFWCGRSAEAWYPGSIDTTGIGGSETAVIQIARRFARDGWRVDVYNEPERWEGEHESVGYWSLSRLGQGESAEVLVSWRQPGMHSLPISARLRLLWCHDLHSGPSAGPEMAQWDRVLGVSQWHADYLSQIYGLTNTDFVPNGIDLARFAVEVSKLPFRCVYASSPDRGLDRLLTLWPFLVQMEPTAELHVAYGWETIDKYIAMGAGHLVQVKARLLEQLKATPQVVWRGRLSQGELAQLYQESYLWLYPTSFLEVSCISAMEAMAGGAVPVTSSAGALRETIGDAGVLVEGNTYTQGWREYYTLVARGALTSRDLRKSYAAKGLKRVQGQTWDAAYSKWQQVLNELSQRGGEREGVPA